MITAALKAEAIDIMASEALAAYPEGSWQATRLEKMRMMCAASLEFGNKFVILSESDLALLVKPQ